MSKTGLVLSGGGTRCIVQLGIVKALKEFGISPDIISGTSGGAVVGAFLSKGYSPETIADIISKSRLFEFKNFLFGKSGFFNMTLFEKVILDHFPDNSFESLPIPLHVTATDIIHGEAICFSSGKLSTAIIASSCIPVVFEPIQYQGYTLVDGGVVNNFPVEPLAGQCDRIIGIYANAVSSIKKKFQMKEMMDRSIQFMLRQTIVPKIASCDLFFEPPEMTQFSMFDFEKSDEIFKYGYEYARQQENKILAFRNKSLPPD